jgi:hypothetical protein
MGIRGALDPGLPQTVDTLCMSVRRLNNASGVTQVQCVSGGRSQISLPAGRESKYRPGGGAQARAAAVAGGQVAVSAPAATGCRPPSVVAHVLRGVWRWRVRASVRGSGRTVAALPAASDTEYEMMYGVSGVVSTSILTAPAPNLEILEVRFPSTLSNAVAPGSTNRGEFCEGVGGVACKI